MMNEIKKYYKKVVLPISMSVREIQWLTSALCMVNSVIKKVDTIVFVVIRLWLLPRQYSLLFLSVTSGVSC